MRRREGVIGEKNERRKEKTKTMTKKRENVKKSLEMGGKSHRNGNRIPGEEWK